MQTPDTSLIHARGLIKRFGDFIAVDGIDFDVAKGEAFGFLGPNGAGKTSTMRMIGCVSPVSAGTLSVLGMDPLTDGPRIRFRLGVVPQADTLDAELRVDENLETYARYFGIPRAIARTRAKELLEFVQLQEHGRDRPEHPGRRRLSRRARRARPLGRGRAAQSRPAEVVTGVWLSWSSEREPDCHSVLVRRQGSL